MRNILFFILTFVMITFATEKEFKTFAMCTDANGIEYCAVSPTKSVLSYNDTNKIKYELKNFYGVVYTYDIKPNTLTDTAHKGNPVSYSDVIENSVESTNIPYNAIESEKLFVLVDMETTCYSKKFFIGTVDEFRANYKFVSIDVNDYLGFYQKCVNSLGEND